MLARLATESDAVLAPLAKAKRQLADFVVQANTTSVASASRAADISRSFQLFPTFLRQLRPLVADLGKLADQGTPLMNTLRQSADDVSRQFENLAPFANAARPALIELGNSAQQSQAPLVATLPLARRLDRLATQTEPTAKSLDKLTSSLDQTGAIEYLMSLLFRRQRDEHVRQRRPPGPQRADGGLVRLLRQAPGPGLLGELRRRRRAGLEPRQRPARAAPAPSAADVAAASCATRSAGANSTQRQDGSGKTLQGLLGYLLGSGR